MAASMRPRRRAVLLAGVRSDDFLFDGAEHALPVLALHLDADGVAEAHELGGGLAVLDRLDCRLLGDAAVALGPFGLAAGARYALVADGARTDDAARPHVARLAHVRDQLVEVEGHVGAGLAHADLA